jgi:hypothetical protein
MKVKLHYLLLQQSFLDSICSFISGMGSSKAHCQIGIMSQVRSSSDTKLPFKDKALSRDSGGGISSGWSSTIASVYTLT